MSFITAWRKAMLIDAAGDPIALATAANQVAATPAGENHIGQVGGPANVVQITPVLDTLIHAAGDTLFNTTVLALAARVNGGVVVLQSLSVTDQDDQGAALDLYLLESNTTFGAINAPPSITDVGAADCHYIGSLATGDWKDVGGAKVASLRNIGLMVKCLAGNRSLYLAAVTQGTPTHTSGGLVVRVGFQQF